MGSSETAKKNQANKYKNYPPGCVPYSKGYRPGNPGTFEDIHKKFDALEPKSFEGLRLVIRKVLSKHFNVTHTIAMNSKTPSLLKSVLKEEVYEGGYRFGASYTGIKRIGYREKYPIVYGDITPDGNLNANFIHTLGCRFRVKLAAQVKKNSYKSFKATTEYRTDDMTLSASLVDPIVLKQEGVLLIQLLQAITSRIALGAEIACNKNAKFPGGRQTNFACAFRYSTGFRTLSATVGHAGVRICYHHKQSTDLQMGVEFQSNFVTHQSKGKVLYQLDIPVADVVFQGFVDSHWKVGAVFMKKLYPMPEATLALSGILDHIKQNVSVGIGLHMGE